MLLTVVVLLATIVIGLKVEGRLVDVANDLDVVWRSDELDTLECARRDHPRSVCGGGAVRNELFLLVCDGSVRVGRSPDAEVVDGIDECSLAPRVRSESGGVAKVVSL